MTKATTTESTNDTTETDGEVQVIEEAGHEIERMVNDRYRGEPQVSDMDLADSEIKFKVYNAASAQATPLSEMVGKPFVIEHWLAERVTLQFGDKPSYKGCRLTLWDTDGAQYFTSAASLVTGVGRMVRFFGNDLAAIGRQVEITAGLTTNKQRWFNIELIEPKKTKK